MPVFVWWAVVLLAVGFSAQVFLDDKTVVEQVVQSVESVIALFDLPLLLLGVGLMLFFLLRGVVLFAHHLKLIFETLSFKAQAVKNRRKAKPNTVIHPTLIDDVILAFHSSSGNILSPPTRRK